MRKLWLIPLMVAALLAVQGAVQEPVAAQAKKDVKKDAKKDATKTTGVIEIGEGKDGKFRFFVRDADNKLVAMSSPGGFTSVKDAQEAIDELKAIVGSAKVTNIGKKKDKDEK